MGYSAGALSHLTWLVRQLPSHGALLELGAQDINAGVPSSVVEDCARAAHPNDLAAAHGAAQRYDPSKPMPVSELFRRSPYRYRCIDVMPGPATMKIDLNRYAVPWHRRATFDLITNFGTSEHVTDQVNTFRVIHDFAKVGARFVHSVPFAGYFNHGLFNYHPAFFVFLANANEYEIESMALSEPHSHYTIPTVEGLGGTGLWRDVQQSGMLTCVLRKTRPRRFNLFTDYDQAVMNRLPLQPPWDAMIRDRYDLRVRNENQRAAS